jgi:hypothetical protein
MKRRSTDKCVIKRLWDKFTPYIQTAGFVFLIIPLAILVVDLIPKAEAFDKRLTIVEQNNVIANQKLDLVIQLLRNK